MTRSAYRGRLAKREDAASLRTLREKGVTPEEIRRQWRGGYLARATK